MNYRHAFHAGNFADVFKHAILARALAYLVEKPAPLRFVDTHAGPGLYDLSAAEAARTGEWRDGIGRVDPAALPPRVAELLAPYLAALGPRGADGAWRRYPGSPAVAQRLLRAHDRLVLCELHPKDAEALRRNLGGDRRVRVAQQDGYAALNAVLPPPERRGLVLVDPPFERADEFDALLEAATRAHRKWATGCFLLWYPLKDPAAAARFARGLTEAGIRRVLGLSLRVGLPGAGLAGTGLAVVNPPFPLAAEAETLLPWMAATLARSPGAADWSVRWIAGP